MSEGSRMCHHQEEAPLPHPVLLIRAYEGSVGASPPRALSPQPPLQPAQIPPDAPIPGATHSAAARPGCLQLPRAWLLSLLHSSAVLVLTPASTSSPPPSTGLWGSQTSVRTPVQPLIPCGILAWPCYFICNISSSVEGREESSHLLEWV